MSRITAINTTNIGSFGNPVQLWEYDYSVYNSLGNMFQRADNITGQKENFEYDNMNRLNHVYYIDPILNVDLETQTLHYDIRGNITSKTDAGTFVYDNAAKPNTLTRITSPASIPANHNLGYYINGKTKYITQGSDSLVFTYGPDLMRKKTMLYHNNVLQKTKYFALGIYEEEKDEQSGITTKYDYIAGGDGLAAIYKKAGTAAGTMLYVHKDILGSIDVLTNANGTIVERYSYDAWGNRRNPDDWQLPDTRTSFAISRGFTAQEHLDIFGLINLNGRIYEPLTGRFLSADDYITSTSYSQSFNCFAYCLNNPLSYTDPSGNWAGWDDVIVGGVGFAVGYVSYGITNKDWGWKAVGAGAISSATFLIGYYTSGAGSMASTFSSGGFQAQANTVALASAGKMTINAAIASFMPSMNLQLNDHFSVSVSPGLGFGSNGLAGGVNFSGTYSNGDWTLSAGGGLSSTGYTVSGAVGYDGYSYYQTYFGGGSYSQTVGGIGIQKGDFSLRIENDYFAGGGEDRWRSSAVEIGIGDFIVGTNVFTNDPGNEGSGVDPNGHNLRGKLNKPHNNGYGAWENGQVYSAPLYIGYRNGNQVTRVGYGDPWVQDRTQNFIHKNFGVGDFSIGYQNFYNNYENLRRGPYSYSGYYNPFTLY